MTPCLQSAGYATALLPELGTGRNVGLRGAIRDHHRFGLTLLRTAVTSTGERGSHRLFLG